MNNPIDPPGINRSVDRTQELPATAKAMYAAMKKRDGLNLQDAIALGRLLSTIKDKTDRGKWGDLMQEMEIPHQRVTDYIRLAKSPAPAISKLPSIREAMLYLEWLDGLCKGCFHLVCFKDSKPKQPCHDCKKKKVLNKKKKQQRQGGALFEWKDFEAAYQEVNVMPDVLVENYPQIKQTAEYRAWDEHLNWIITIATRWYKEIVKGQK